MVNSAVRFWGSKAFKGEVAVCVVEDDDAVKRSLSNTILTSFSV